MKNFLPHISSFDAIELNALNFVAKELEYGLMSIGVSNTSHSETHVNYIKFYSPHRLAVPSILLLEK
jgi:hypothetical protein